MNKTHELSVAKSIDEALKIACGRLWRSVPEAEVYAAHVSRGEDDLVWRVELSVAHFSRVHVYDVERARK